MANVTRGQLGRRVFRHVWLGMRRRRLDREGDLRVFRVAGMWEDVGGSLRRKHRGGGGRVGASYRTLPQHNRKVGKLGRTGQKLCRRRHVLDASPGYSTLGTLGVSRLGTRPRTDRPRVPAWRSGDQRRSENAPSQDKPRGPTFVKQLLESRRASTNNT